MLHSNKTHALIANPPNSAQLEDIPTIYPSYTGVRAVVWECGKGQTDTQTHVTNTHFASAMPHAKCIKQTWFKTLPHPPEAEVKKYLQNRHSLVLTVASVSVQLYYYHHFTVITQDYLQLH